jgi:hypothetical protein
MTSRRVGGPGAAQDNGVPPLRLIDQIRTGTPLCPVATYVTPSEWQAFDLKVRQELDKSVEFFQADNIDQFFYATHPEIQDRDIKSVQPGFEEPELSPLVIADEYPNAIPPYPRTWVEWTPSIPVWKQTIQRFGAFIASERRDDGGWSMTILGFLQIVDKSYILMSVLVPRVSATADGLCQGVSESLLDIASLEPYPEADPLCSLFVHIPLLTFCFLQCRNVHVDWAPSPGPWQKRFKERHGKLPIRRVGTIVITPMSRLVSAAVKDEKDPARRNEIAAHKFRTHRKTYTEQGKLFGKWTGTFIWNWAPVKPFARRSVESDYRLNLAGIDRRGKPHTGRGK